MEKNICKEISTHKSANMTPLVKFLSTKKYKLRNVLK